MSERFMIGDLGGTMRLRVAKPGFDATNPALTNEQLVYDSAWPEILSVRAMSLSTAAGIGKRVMVSGGLTFVQYYSTIGFPALPFAPIVLAWEREDFTPPYTPRYWHSGASVASSSFRVLAPSVANDAGIAAPNGTRKFAYYVLNKPLVGSDPAEAAGGGANSFSLGNHPSRPPGLYISRRGADVDYCGDDDLTLSTLRPNLQVAESGNFFGNASSGFITGTVTLARSHPKRPPVIFRGGSSPVGTGVVSRSALSAHWWIDDQHVGYSLACDGSSQQIYYTILDYDESYAPGYDDASTNRWMIDSTGLKISKKNVDVLGAGEADLLLNTERSVLHVKDRLSYTNPSGGANVGAVPTTAAISNPPLVMFGIADGAEWYCANSVGVANTLNWAYILASGSVPFGGRAYAQAGQISYVFPAGTAGQGFHAAVIEHS